MSATLAEVGGALRILGVLVSAVGLMRTWRDFPPGERFLEPLIGPPLRRARRALSRLGRAFARWRGKGIPMEVEGSAASAFGAAFAADALIGYGPLPPQPPEASIAALDVRTREISTRLTNAAQKLETSISVLRDAAAKREAEVTDRLHELERRDVRIATGGIRIAALGLLMIGVGELLQLVAPLFT